MPFFGSSSRDSLLLPGDVFLGLALSPTRDLVESLTDFVGETLEPTCDEGEDEVDSDE